MGRYAQRRLRGGGPQPVAPTPPPPTPAAVDFVEADPMTAGDLIWWWTEDVTLSAANVLGLEADPGGGNVPPDGVVQVGPRRLNVSYVGQAWTAGMPWSLASDPAPDLTSTGGITTPASGLTV